MTLPAETALRSAIIATLKADAALQATAMGAVPRVLNRVAPGTPFPFIRVSQNFRPWDTTSDRGGEHDVTLHLFGEYEGDKQGEAIFYATQIALRDWAPRALTDHWLVNMELRFQDVRSEEDGKRYYGAQRWRAVSEEASVVFVPPPPSAGPSLKVEEEERQTRLAAETLSALRLVKAGADGRVSYADHNTPTDGWALVGVTETAANVNDPVNIRTSGLMVDASWSWATNAPLFLGAAGAITTLAPATGVLVRIGTALSATAIRIGIEDPILL